MSGERHVFPEQHGLFGSVTFAALLSLLGVEREREVVRARFMDQDPRLVRIVGFTDAVLEAGASNGQDTAVDGLPKYASSDEEEELPQAGSKEIVATTGSGEAAGGSAVGNKHARSELNASAPAFEASGVVSAAAAAAAELSAAAAAAAELGMEEEEAIPQVVKVYKEVLLLFLEVRAAKLFYKVDGKNAVAGTDGAELIFRKQLARLGASGALIPWRKENGQASRLWSGERPAHLLPGQAVRIMVLRADTMELLARTVAVSVKILIGLPPAGSKEASPRGWVGLAAGAGTGCEADAEKSLKDFHTSSLCADDMITYTAIKQGARASLVADASEMGASVFIIDGAARGSASIAAGIVREGLVGSPEGLSAYERNRAHMKFTM